jgi:hypothetical protein
MTQQEKANISNFISQIAKKEYKGANDALEKTIATKLKERIKNALESKN